MSKSAYFIRQKTIKDWSKKALEDNKIFIGWSRAEGLTEIGKTGYYDLRNKLISTFGYSTRKAGNAAGHLWRFKNAEIGDIIAIPCEGGICIGKITSLFQFNSNWLEEDRAYYRDVEWEFNKQIFPRNLFKNDLQRAMKGYGTVIEITDYADQMLKDADEIYRNPEALSLRSDVLDKVYDVMLNELVNGRMNDHQFEKLVEKMLKVKGYETKVVARNQDNGTDIECSFSLLHGIEIPLFIQVKQYTKDSEVKADVVEKLLDSMKLKKADFGAIITTATVSIDAQNLIDQINDSNNPQTIAFINGKQLCDELIATGIFPDFEI